MTNLLRLSAITPDMFRQRYADAMNEPRWIQFQPKLVHLSMARRIYLHQTAKLLSGLSPKPQPIEAIHDAKVLLKLGDSITTDHISPAGSFQKRSSRSVVSGEGC